MCPRRLMKREKGFMSWELLRKIIEESRGKTKSCYFHQMGEPLLHPEIIPMIKYIRSANIWTCISTNALLLTPEVSMELFKADLSRLIISFDTANPEVYQLARTGSNFKRALDNINQCLDLRQNNRQYQTHIELQMIEMGMTEGYVKLFKDRFESKVKGIGNLLIKPYVMWAGHVPDKRPASYVPKPYVCTMFNYSMSVYWNGDVVTCCMDYDGFTKMGNANDQSLQAIWDSEKYEEFRLAHKHKDFSKLTFCKGCYQAVEKNK